MLFYLVAAFLTGCIGGAFVAATFVTRPAKTPAEGWWHTNNDLVKHNCTLPNMPPGFPGGLMFRCNVCANIWTWRS